MAKHAKPTATSTLSKNGVRSAAALAMASIGFLATAPAAVAGGGKHQAHDPLSDGDIDYRWSNDKVDVHESNGVVNVSDNTVRVPIQVCHNSVPVNVLGVQVPVQDVSGAVAVGSSGDGEVSASPNSCDRTTDQTG